MFCTTCGTKVEQEVQQSAPAPQPVPQPVSQPVSQPAPFAVPPVYAPVPAPRKPKAKIDLAKIIGLLIGSVLVLIGIITVLSAGTRISSTSFGADFYTYTYRGIVAISEQLASIHAALGWVIVAIGAAIDVNALTKK